MREWLRRLVTRCPECGGYLCAVWILGDEDEVHATPYRPVHVKVSDGHGYVPQATIDLYGEAFLRHLTGVDHIHPLDLCGDVNPGLLAERVGADALICTRPAGHTGVHTDARTLTQWIEVPDES